MNTLMDKSNFLNKEFHFFDYFSNIIFEDQILEDSYLQKEKLSVLEIYKPYLILYILPNIFSNNIFLSFIRCSKLIIKILIENFIKIIYDIEISDTEQIKNKTQSKKIALINFTPHFYEESLKKIATYKTDSINFSTFKITQTRKINLLIEKHYQFKKNISLLKILFKTHKKIKKTFGKINSIELYLNLYYLFNRLLPNHNEFINNIDYHKIKKFDIIIANDFAEPISRSILLISKNLKVKTLIIQQGISSMTYPEWAFNFSDYTFICGEKTKEHIEFQNKFLKNIIITGIPNFDIENEKNVKEKKYFYNILLATQPYFPNSFESRFQRIKIFFSIIYLCILNKNIFLTIKSHPSETKIFYKFFSLFFKKIKFTDEKITTLIPNYDVFITSFSQTSIYSILNGIPTINVYFGSSKCHTDYIYSGASIVISNFQELKYHLNHIEEVIDFNYEKRKLEPWIYLRDNKSIKRIIDNLIKI